jgi:hypothetical protein
VKHVPEWFPGAGFKKKAREEGGVAKVALEVPFQYVIDAMVSYTCLCSWVFRY